MTMTSRPVPAGTIGDFISGRLTAPVYLPTFHGPARVAYVRNPTTDPWAVCPDLNAGFGLSFCVDRGMLLYASAADAAAARS